MKFIKYVATLALVATAMTASAATPNDSSSFDTLYVSDSALSSSDWSSSVTLTEDELLSFELHYYLAEGVSATDMRFSLENLNGRTYQAGESETVTGKITADNLSDARGSVRVNFADNVRLDLYNVSWQKYPCSSVGCEESLVDSYANVVTASGMSIGNVSGDNSHYTGNVIVSYRVSEWNPTPDYDDCTLDGVTVQHGDSYRFYSRETTTGSCSAYDLVRTCNDGDLSGSNDYRYASCSVVSIDDAEVTTLSANNIDTNSARLRGDLDLNDWDDADVFFRWGRYSGSLNNATPAVSKSNDGTFVRTISGLQDDTTYYYRAIARSDDGDIERGAIRSFTTDDHVVDYDDCTLDGVTVQHGDSYRFYSRETTTGSCSAYDLVRTCNDGDLSGSNDYRYASCSVIDNDEIDITTNSAIYVDEDSARLRGEMDGDDNIDVWFAFDEYDSTPSCNSSSQEVGETTVDDGDDFSHTVSGLDDDERYYFRACGEDDDGDIVSGAIRSFTTDEEDDDEEGDVDTLSATNIDEDSARLRGEWEGDDNIDVWFAFDEYDSTPSCNSSSQEVGETTVDDGDDFAETVTDLDENEKYYFRACAEDSDGDILSGSIRDFTTDEENGDDDDDEIDVTTFSATNIDEDSARLRGEMDGDDNIDVWFAFDENDSTPSCNASSQEVGNTTVDDGDDFAETVTGLDANEKYYYRACGEDIDGDVVSGSIRDFTTDEDGDRDEDEDEEPRAITNIASGITTNSARLNAYVFGEGNATCYFQYGRTSSLGLTSPRDSVDLDVESTCSSFRSGLASDERYYYRAVLVKDGEVYYGNTLTFRTNRVITTTPTNPNPGDGDTNITIINRDEGGDDLEVTKWVSAEDDPRFDTYTQAAPGETVYYKVRVENNTDEDLDDLVVTDRIPFYLELDTDRGSDDDEDKNVEWVIDLDEGDSRTFVTEMRVREDADRGDIIVSYASAESEDYSANSNDVEIEVVEDLFEDDDNGSQGAFIFGASIFPDDLTGWGILILILLAIAYFISQIMISRNENRKVKAEIAAARAARGNM